MDERVISEVISLVSERDKLKRIVGNIEYGMYLASKSDVPDLTLPIPESVITKGELIARCRQRINEISEILGEL